MRFVVKRLVQMAEAQPLQSPNSFEVDTTGPHADCLHALLVVQMAEASEAC
jgi:hypothetical protein